MSREARWLCRDLERCCCRERHFPCAILLREQSSVCSSPGVPAPLGRAAACLPAHSSAGSSGCASSWQRCWVAAGSRLAIIARRAGLPVLPLPPTCCCPPCTHSDGNVGSCRWYTPQQDSRAQAVLFHIPLVFYTEVQSLSAVFDLSCRYLPAASISSLRTSMK